MASRQPPEITLKQWIESPWFKGSARAMMFVAAGMSGYVAWVTTNLNARVDDGIRPIQEQVSAIDARTNERAKDNEQFQIVVNNQLASLSGQVSMVRVDLGTVRGILEEMRRNKDSDVASAAAGWQSGPRLASSTGWMNALN